MSSLVVIVLETVDLMCSLDFRMTKLGLGQTVNGMAVEKKTQEICRSGQLFIFFQSSPLSDSSELLVMPESSPIAKSYDMKCFIRNDVDAIPFAIEISTLG